MGILDPKDKNRLLAIDQLRRFVRNGEGKYVKKLKEWKRSLPKDAELADPRLLAATLSGHLMMFDENLRSIMWSIWENDELRIIQFYDIIAKYFVDRESEI